MAKFDTIKTAIDANINTNGNQAITGSVMNSVLKQMVDSTDAELTELELKVAILGSEAVDGITSVFLDISSLPKSTYKVKVDFGGETFANFKIWQRKGLNSGNIISQDVQDGVWADIKIDDEANYLLFFSSEEHSYTLSYELVSEDSQVYKNQIELEEQNSIIKELTTNVSDIESNVRDIESNVGDIESNVGKFVSFDIPSDTNTDQVIDVRFLPKGYYKIKPKMTGATTPASINVYRTTGKRKDLIYPLYTNCLSEQWVEIEITPETNYLWLFKSDSGYEYKLDIEFIKADSEHLKTQINSEYALNGLFAYSIDENNIWVSKASGEEQIVVGISKSKANQGNGLPDIRSIGTLPLGEIPTSDNVNVLHYSSSDWIAPFKIRAVNNADGDDLTGDTFTGGSHQYNNAITGGTPTAKLLYMKVYVDGVLTESGQGYASRLKINWVSQIQGTNTKKEDGSGRYILEEYVTLEYDGNTWQCTTLLNPLESIYLDLWYGYQFTGIGDAGIFSQWSFIGAKNRANNSTISGDNDCIGVRAIGDKVLLEMWLNDRVDMGKRQFCHEGLDRSAFKSGGKAYFTIANNKSVLQSYSPYILKGEYKIRLK